MGEERGEVRALPTPPSPTQVSLTFASGRATGAWWGCDEYEAVLIGRGERGREGRVEAGARVERAAQGVPWGACLMASSSD